MSAQHQDDFLQMVNLINLFSALTLQDSLSLCALARRREYDRGEMIFDEGQEAPGLFLVQSGAVMVEKKLSGGAMKSLATLRAPTFFGEMSLVTRQPTSARIVAAEPTVCWVLDTAEFEKRLAANELAAYKTLAAVARVLADRLKTMDQEVLRLLSDLSEEKRAAFQQIKGRMMAQADAPLK